MTLQLRGNRAWGAALVVFVIVQFIYLYFDVVVMTAPALDAPMSEWRAMISVNQDRIRWHILIPLFNFFGLLLPASVALSRQLRRAAPNGSIWPDLVVPGAVLVTVTVVLGEMTLGIFGLVPIEQLSDSVVRTVLMANTYTIFVAGNLAGALLSGAASLAMLQSHPSPRWLGWLGIITACLGVIGALWLINGNTEGLVFGLGILSRGFLLLWVMTTGFWLYRTANPALPDMTPTS